MLRRSLTALLTLSVLTGCVGQANPLTMQMLYNAQIACAQGDQAQCAYVPALRYQADLEIQQDAQIKNAQLFTGIAAAAGIAALGVAVSNAGNWDHGYYGYREYGGYHHH